MDRTRYSRRSFLRTLGIGAALALPITRVLEREAFGDGTFPMRYLGIYSPHGTVLDFWRPQNVQSETDFSLTLVYP